MMNIEEARTNMITQQARAWGVLDDKILGLLQTVPREMFVPECYKSLAFADITLPLDHGQMMWTPKEEARLLQALAIKPMEKVLEIGTGSAYLTALLASQAKTVLSVDIFPEFIAQAKLKLAVRVLHNVSFQCADGLQGWAEAAPFDVIVVAGALASIPLKLQQQLAINGRMFVIIGQPPMLSAQLLTRKTEFQWNTDFLYETAAPPLQYAPLTSAFIF